MNQTKAKLIEFIREAQESLFFGREELKRRNMLTMSDEENYKIHCASLRYYVDILKRNPEEKSNEIFQDFENFSGVLSISPLNLREQFQLIEELLAQNIANGLLEKNALITDIRDFEQYPFQTMSKEEALQMVCDGAGIFSQEKSLSKEERAKLQEVSTFLMKSQRQSQVFVKSHRVLQENYFQKRETYEAEDIEKIIASLQELKIASDLVDGIHYLLQSRFGKRKKAKEAKKLVFAPSSTSSRSLLTNKEYHELQKELEKYYSFTEKQPIRALSLSEKVHCTNLLWQMGLKEEEIKRILKQIDRKTAQEEYHPLAKYTELYSKISYYETKNGSQESRQRLEECLQEMMFASPEDYAIWKEIAQEEMQNLIHWMPRDQEYEIQQAKQYKKSRENYKI